MSHRAPTIDAPRRRRDRVAAVAAVAALVLPPARRPSRPDRPLDTSTRGRTLLFGTSAVALMIAASRWGSYIGANPLFLTDLLLAGGVACAIFLRRSGSRPGLDGYSARSTPGPVYILFVVYVIARMFVALLNQPILLTFRDAVPYLYAAVGMGSALAVARSTPDTRRRSAAVLYWALVAHLAWATPVAFTGFVGVDTPLVGTPVFSVRPDIDSALFGVGAGVFLIAHTRSFHRVTSSIGLVASGASVVFVSTRAGLLSFLVCVVVATGLIYCSHESRPSRRATMRILIPLVAFIALAALSQTTLGERAVATVFPDSASSVAQYNAVGTQTARAAAWQGVIEWTQADAVRTVVGSGFGNNILTESGTRRLLEGTTFTNVRSPHNYFVGAYARLGFIGLMFVLTIMVQVLTCIWRRRREALDDPLFAATALMFVAIIPVASLGVVLEAPFGAIPFWWSAGMLLAVSTPGFRRWVRKPASGEGFRSTGQARRPSNPVRAERRTVATR